ncbi:MAG: lysylphosphatidylglycerol synthase transmembrane domain-containing protein [Chloroflexota bacterium]
MRRILFLLLGLIISVGAIYFAFQGFNLADVWVSMGRVRLPFFLLMIVPYVLTFLTKVWRWQVLFHPDEARAPFRILFPTLMISYIPLPFRLGEVARGAVASARSGVPAARVFSTIFVEKVLDVLTLLLFLGIGLPFVDLPDTSGRDSLILVGVVVLVLVVLMIAIVLRPEIARNLVKFVSRPLPPGIGARLLDITENVLKGLAPLANISIALRVGFWSIATWGINMVTVYLMMLAFNIEVTPVAAVVLVVATNLSMAIPAAPGYVGTFEAAVVAVLMALGQSRDVSQSFAIIYHFVGLVPVAAIGAIAALQQGINFSTLGQSGASPTPAPIDGPQPATGKPRSPEGS